MHTPPHTEQNRTRISIVIPAYRSADSLPLLIPQLHTTLQALNRPFEIIVVDDASPDKTWDALLQLKANHPDTLKILRHRVNQGQHQAILCGLAYATGDIVVTMDDDLQNPPEEVPRLIAPIDQGYDLAIASYDSEKQSTFRKTSGDLVDAVQRRIYHLPPSFELTSFRAIARRVVDGVHEMNGTFPYITCMLFANARTYTNVPVRHDSRRFGRSNYTLRRSLPLVFNIIFTYSIYPLYLVMFICAVSLIATTTYGTWILTESLFDQSTVPGWSSTILTTVFSTSIILFTLLILLVYVMRISQQTGRPRANFNLDHLHE
jgi:glycosyltransferase involved in cell wall biosynthesis